MGKVYSVHPVSKLIKKHFEKKSDPQKSWFDHLPLPFFTRDTPSISLPHAYMTISEVPEIKFKLQYRSLEELLGGGELVNKKW